MAAFILTRIRTEGYDRWRALYDQDVPRAREHAVSKRVFRLVDSGVLDRFGDVHGPNVVEEVWG